MNPALSSLVAGKVSVEESLVVNVHGPKHLFTERDARRILKALRTKGDPTSFPHRYRIRFHYIFLEYLRTGARLGLSYKVRFSRPVYNENS